MKYIAESYESPDILENIFDYYYQEVGFLVVKFYTVGLYDKYDLRMIEVLKKLHIKIDLLNV